MKIQCDKCGAQGNADDAKIPPQGAKVSCPRCKNVFFVKKEEPPSVFSLESEEVLATSPNEPPQIEEDAFTVAKEADNVARQGKEFLKKKMFEEALKSFQKVVALNSNHPDGYRNLGIIYGQEKMWSEALKAFEKAVEVNPNDFQSQKNLGILYLQQKNFEGASSALEKAMVLNPTDEKVQTYLSLAQKGRKGQSEAVSEAKYFQASIPQAPSTPFFSPLSSIKEEKIALPEKPLEEEEQFPEIDLRKASPPSVKPPSNPLLEKKAKVNSLLDEACDLLDNQKPKDAISKCKEALEIEPYNPSIYFMMGLIYEERQLWDQAVGAYEKALELNPNHEDARRNLSFVKKQRKKPIWKIWARK